MVESKGIVKIVFLALVLDLLAFTIPLPLFPRLTAWYLQLDSSPDSLLSKLLWISRKWRSTLISFSSPSSTINLDEGKKEWDIVLLGGAMGSLFSFCQCVISPWLGSLSDRYGRKKVLIAAMMGNLLSAIIWIQSTSFASFLLSRLVGGLSEGNVQLSTAIISDVTTSANRSKSLALVGIAFSICFTLGPSLGAYFASRPIPLTSPDNRLNVYALPATISLILLSFETLYLAIKLPETKGWQKSIDTSESKENDKQEKKIVLSVEERLRQLKVLGRLHGLFLLFFSGAEFTLTFLTYDLFAASNAQNGRLLSYIGILSALLQARHVRPSLTRLGELKLSSYGMISCIIALLSLSILPLSVSSTSSNSKTLSTVILYFAATCLSYTSATVVTGLTASAASLIDENEKDKNLQRGKILGKFRSEGQLGRAIGPLLASSIYWLKGPTIAYSTLAGCLSLVYLLARSHIPNSKKKVE
ncbi:uncharacterized protein L201_002803 [Kwoniella dendrophila CBS 6074]|uniref:Major facilitator superfamily (MFS) profile domain-containing protein n=1 Tax=Kwoniella dendrophila CBS 6074 TaxID=1295534 RepID=A0AAX4JSM5_9TREE